MNNPCGICGAYDHPTYECYQDSDPDSVELWNNILKLSEQYRREHPYDRCRFDDDPETNRPRFAA